VGSIAPAWAQQANPYGAQVQRVFDTLSKKLNLNATQKQQIAAILREAAPQGRAIHESSKLTPPQKQEKLQALRKAIRQKISEVLTPRQREEAKRLYVNREQTVRNALQEVADELEMTPAQRSQAKPIIENAVQEGRAIAQDFSLQLPQKRAKLTALHQKTRGQLNSILTPEQQQKLDQMKAAVQTEMMARFLANRDSIRGMK
jgi:Spy/CpxP family protein refolding chaperone